VDAQLLDESLRLVNDPRRSDWRTAVQTVPEAVAIDSLQPDLSPLSEVTQIQTIVNSRL
jgi:hypothetical protein